ncbi:transposase domain-containing protein, partial [Marinobacter sp.]|uniref:transposase domain-containing protein n=1 Tax=Marinobacter sp. TaxID=50741 RepID=UPI002BA1EE42|nr:transposase [Marinobacter sp.]
MSTGLHILPKSELIERLAAEQKTAQSRLEKVTELQQRLSKKDQIIAQLQRMLFGQSRERFDRDPDQGRLPFDSDPIVEKAREVEHEQAAEGVRKKASRPNHNGRGPLPDHLPVEEVHIYPDGDYSAMVCIGQEVTD